VDGATFWRTVIKRGTKVDNMVQIAHNVTIGEYSILVAQVGIAGSTTVGSDVMIGGQAGLADHLDIGDRVIIAARDGVNRSLTGGQIVSGTPAIPHAISIKAQAVIPRLPELRQHVRALEQRVTALGTRSAGTTQTAKGQKKQITSLSQPALALSAPDPSGVNGDGLLTMEKILGLRLIAVWVVLAACNTAGGNGAGSEAVSGLGRAFFYAGARALLVM
jgi:carbonic anhydrase/acetyltransferase-like protein (isoleucine patch superfamily)/predicted small secreted protein